MGLQECNNYWYLPQPVLLLIHCTVCLSEEKYLLRFSLDKWVTGRCRKFIIMNIQEATLELVCLLGFSSRKTHPGPVVHLSDNPLDPSKVSLLDN